MHITPSAQLVDATEVLAVSTNTQRSSSQQGINLLLKSNMNSKKKSLVVAVVAVNFLAWCWLAGTVGALNVRSFPPISTHRKRLLRS
jgi:hypothetical protein